MDRHQRRPVTCPSCKKATGQPQRVTALSGNAKSVTMQCDRCGSEWAIVVNVVLVPDVRKRDGPRLDSDLRTINSLFGGIRTGWNLVESAQKLPAGGPYRLSIDAAKRSVSNIQQLTARAKLTDEERHRLEHEILVLQAAIESSQPRS